MKKFIIFTLMIGLVGSASATTKAELDARIRRLTQRFELLQSSPDKHIPAAILNKAEGIVLMERTKAGFLFAFQGGFGIAMVRDPQTREWSPAGFVNANEASVGFQVGGQQSFVVVLMMNTNSAASLTGPISEFGGEARGTVGRSAAGFQGSATSLDEPCLVYSDLKGLYGGADVKGGAIYPADDQNRRYYEDYVSMTDILYNKKVQPTESVLGLAQQLNQDSQVATK